MKRNQLSKIMRTAWFLVKRNGFTMSEGLKQAWLIIKTKMRMAKGIIEFRYRKVDGSIRQAFGTLKSSLLPPTKSGYEEKQYISTTQCYFDTEAQGWRSFRIVNLLG